MPASRDGFLNKKQELFCRYVARGETLSHAYELAGYAPSTSNASTLAARPDIKARIAELKKEYQADEARHMLAIEQAKLLARQQGDPEILQKQVEWSFNRIMDMIAENVRLAQIAGSFGAANDALKMMGDAMGMFDKAVAAAVPPTNPMISIGKVIAEMPALPGEAPMKPANPLAPAVAE